VFCENIERCSRVLYFLVVFWHVLLDGIINDLMNFLVGANPGILDFIHDHFTKQWIDFISDTIPMQELCTGKNAAAAKEWIEHPIFLVGEELDRPVHEAVREGAIMIV